MQEHRSATFCADESCEIARHGDNATQRAIPGDDKQDSRGIRSMWIGLDNIPTQGSPLDGFS